jgi:hypothetical protein
MTNYYIDKRWNINIEGRGRRVPLPAVLFLMPILGLAFVVFLPVIGFVLVGQWFGRRLLGLARPLLDTSPIVVGETHLVGGHGSDAGSTSNNPALEEISKEIQMRRTSPSVQQYNGHTDD